MNRNATRLGVTLGLVVLFAWLAVAHHLANADEKIQAGIVGRLPWSLGAEPATLAQAGKGKIDRALGVLTDPAVPVAERLLRFRANLAEAEPLLARSLRAQPAQAAVLANLVSVRWEMAPPRSPEEATRYTDTIRVAGSLASTVPSVQLRLAELLLRMSQRDEALAYGRRVVELDRGSSRDVVSLLRRHLFTAGELLDALPHEPETLAALENPSFEDGTESEYLLALESAMRNTRSGASASLLRAFGNTSLRVGRAEELLAHLDGIRTDGFAENERLRQRARANLSLGNHAQAIADARLARSSLPDSYRLAEFCGDIFTRTGQDEQARQTYREALSLLARDTGEPLERARLYKKIGAAEERMGEFDKAYDDYVRAVELDPDEEFARERLKTFNKAAGTDAD